MKKGLAKLEETETAWETIAPDDEFYEMTLAQWKARVQLSRDARAALATIEDQRTVAINNKTNIDNENLALEKNIARAIGGSKKHGQDSDLWEATGRVRTSERKTGLTRKKKNGDDN